MKLPLAQIDIGETRLSLTWPAEDLADQDLAGEGVEGRIEVVAPVKAEVVILRRPDRKEVRITGQAATEIKFCCHRCLKDVKEPITLEFSVVLAPSYGVEADEYNLKAEEMDLSLIEGDELDLRAIVREQIVLNWPITNLCRPDCRGLCPVCGADRNQEACACQAPQGDPRLAALAEFRPKLKH